MDPQADAVGGALSDAEQLADVVQFLAGRQVDRIELIDALDVQGPEVDIAAEGKRRHHRQLVGGVRAVDVERRIQLGISGGLGLRQCRGVRFALLVHLAEDVVAGTVENAVDGVDAVGDQPGAQRKDQRDASTDARLERDAATVPPGGRVDLLTVLGQQGLVGGHNALAGAECSQHKILGDGRPADELDYDVDGLVVEDIRGVRTHQRRRDVDLGGLGGVLVNHASQFQPYAGLALDFGRLGLDDADHALPDGSATDQSDSENITH